MARKDIVLTFRVTCDGVIFGIEKLRMKDKNQLKKYDVFRHIDM
jgi:hypothetical protein